MATPRRRRGGLTLNPLIAAVVALTAAGCSASNHPTAVQWTPIPASGLVPAAASSPFTPAVAAAPLGKGWLLGGVVLGQNGSREVAIWSSSGFSRPWTRAAMNPVQGRDGPNETIFGITGDRAHLVAFGYRRSPTEGYPRPSTWLASPAGGTWREILEDREFFGGPNIIGFGGLDVGPHGYSVAGTWTDARGHPVVAVWRSADGSTWTRDSTDPSLEGRPGEIPFASAVADSTRGLLLVGMVETPTPGDPLRRRGGIWFSRSGETWTRLTVGGVGLPLEGSTSFDAVVATSAGWVIAGSEGVLGRSRPAVWLVDNHLRVTPALALPDPPGGGPMHPSSMAVSGAALIAVGPDGHRGVVWAARLRAGVPHGWKLLTSPPDAAFPLASLSVAASQSGLIVALVGSDRSQLWTARPAAALALLRG